MTARAVKRIGALAPFIVVVALALMFRQGPAVPQSIAFNHHKHTQELGLDCAFCHQYHGGVASPSGW